MATRNVAMTISFVAWDTSANVGKTGDSANITPRWVKDGTIAALTTATVTEVDATNAPGLYKCSISATEADCNIGVLCGKSSTANISVMPITIQFERLPDAAPSAAGGVQDVIRFGGTAVTGRDIGTSVLLSSGTGTGQVLLSSGKVAVPDTQKVDVETIKTNPVVNAGTITFPTGATIASTTNITAGTITTVTNLTNMPTVPTNWLTADGLATDAVNEIRNAITGGAYSLDTDANGRIRVVDGTGAGEISLTSGLLDWNSAWDAEVQSEVNDALVALNLDHLLAVATGSADMTTEVVDNSIVSRMLSNGDTSVFDPSTDGLQSIRDRGDAAWLTATGFSTHSAADVWSAGTRVLTANTNLNDPTAAAIADAVWLEAIADHSGTSGSTAEALAAAGSAGDPWTTALPGAYGAGSAGYIIGTNLDSAVSTRGTSTLTQTQVTGGAYALNHASFAFDAALDFTTTQKAATLARVTLTDTASTVTDGAKSATALSTATWTGTLATNLGTTNSTVATNLNATITSRMASYTQPTGFLAATFPTTVASTTNITAASGVALSSAGNTAVATAVEAAILNEGDATALLAAIAAKVEEFLVNEGDATATIAAIATACNSAIVAGTVGSNVTAIKAKTDNLPASPASTTNITAGTITTVTNLTNAPTTGDLTATMKASVTTAATAATPTAAAVTGNVGGNVTGSVGSVLGGIDTTSGTVNTLDATVTALATAHGAGSWATATGFATPTNVTDAQTAIISQVDANETKIDTANAVLAKLNSGLEADGSGGYQGTALFLENGPSGGGDATEANQLQILSDISDVQTAVDAIDVGAGSGPSVVTIAVVDQDDDPIEGVSVRLTDFATRNYVSTTDADGVIDPLIGAEDATYSLVLSKDGYDNLVTALVVSGDTSPVAYVLTLTVVSPASDPAKSTLTVTCYDEFGNIEPGAIVSIQFAVIPSGDNARSYDKKPAEAIADGSGVAAFDGGDGSGGVVRLARYHVWRGSGPKSLISIPDAATCTVTSFLGREIE